MRRTHLSNIAGVPIFKTRISAALCIASLTHLNFRYLGAATPRAGLTPCRLAGIIDLGSYEIEGAERLGHFILFCNCPGWVDDLRQA
jgi:hypothetical protein